MDIFYKFPSTPYLIQSGMQLLRSDKVLSNYEKNEFLANEIIIEEKIDGANLGISFDKDGNVKLQNRGSYIYAPYTGQWKKLNEWLQQKEDKLFDVLGSRYILFGEWCYALHSVKYSKLPDWFIGFDIYDKDRKKFLSTKYKDQYFKKLGIFKVPVLANGKFTIKELMPFLEKKSYFSNEKLEGIYLRYDESKWLIMRAKIVRSGFVQNIQEHWTHKPFEINQLKYMF